MRYQAVFTDVSVVKAGQVRLGRNTKPPHLPLIVMSHVATLRSNNSWTLYCERGSHLAAALSRYSLYRLIEEVRSDLFPIAIHYVYVGLSLGFSPTNRKPTDFTTVVFSISK